MPRISCVSPGIRVVAAAALLLLAEGCSQPPPPYDLAKIAKVNGTVAYKGAPVRGARLTFRSKTAAEPAFAISDAQGKFTGMTNDTNGIVPGEYVITVTHPRGGIPGKYADPETSPLTLSVADGEERDFPIALED